MMASILLAAGVFNGIMHGSGVLNVMAQTAVRLIAMPLGLLFDPDSFYFGVLPVVPEVGRQLGVPPLQFVQAALLGQMTTGFPVDSAAFVIDGLTGINLGDHQKFAIPFLLGASVVMTIACVLFGVFPL